jgi:hypothetical protein
MVRVVIETGLVVLGQVGAGGRIEQGAMGDSVNTAARLQSATPPGTVVVGPITFERVNDLFEWEGPLRLTLKGNVETVKAYRAVRPRLGPAIAPHRIGRDLPVLGRDRELAVLHSAADRRRAQWAACCSSPGEAGVGRSRILAEFRTALTFEGDSQYLSSAAATNTSPVGGTHGPRLKSRGSAHRLCRPIDDTERSFGTFSQVPSASVAWARSQSNHRAVPSEPDGRAICARSELRLAVSRLLAAEPRVPAGVLVLRMQIRHDAR